MTSEERRKLAEEIRKLKPGEKLTVVYQTKQDAEEVRQEVAKQNKRSS